MRMAGPAGKLEVSFGARFYTFFICNQTESWYPWECYDRQSEKCAAGDAAGKESMEENKQKGNSAMIRIASFIVDKRMLFFLIYIIALIFSVIATNWVKVNNDLADYLPETTETKQGLEVMEKEFVTFGTAKVMVANISFPDAKELQSEIEGMDGVSQVEFTDEDADQADFVEHYNNGSALYKITFSYDETDDRALEALNNVKDRLSDYDIYVSTTLGDQQAEIIQEEINKIMVLVAVVVVTVLLLTSESYGEIPVLLITFVASMLLNGGTNFLLGTISFVSNSVSSILQLALSVDYAIIFCNRYKEELKDYDVHDAVVVALSKSIPEICSSSLTTISGLMAMIFMQYRIGADLGVVLIKAILLSLLSVFTLMPGLLVLFSGMMERTKHKNFVPKISAVGRFAYRSRFVLPAIFGVVFVVFAVLSQKTPYVYGYSTLPTPVQNSQQKAEELIEDNFGSENFCAVVVPSGNYKKEAKLIKDLESYTEVDYCQGLANTEAMGGYMLTDELSPRDFSELLDLDYEVAELLYTTYAADQEEYGRIVGGISSYKVPLMDMLMFVYEKSEEGYVTLDSDTQETLSSAYQQISDGRKQLEGEKYDRILVYLTIPLPEQDDASFDFVQTMHDLAQSYYEGSSVYVVGDSTSQRDLRNSFERDNIVVSVMSILFVLVILLFTFKSSGLPVLLVVVIEGAIFINFGIPTLIHEKVFFMGYLIVSSIQMGANIDYAIVISSRYMDCRKTQSRKNSIIEALNFSFPTIITSGSMMILAGVFIGQMTSDACIAGIGECLGRGTMISVFLVMFVLPQILLVGDKLIEKTTFEIERPVKTKEETGTVVINGAIRGTINGTVIGTMNAVVRGDVKAIVVSGSMEKASDPDAGTDAQGKLPGPVEEAAGEQDMDEDIDDPDEILNEEETPDETADRKAQKKGGKQA